jgi:hypothetical protein
MELMSFYDLLVMKLYRLIEEIEKAQYKNIDEKLLLSRCLYTINNIAEKLNGRAEQLK